MIGGLHGTAFALGGVLGALIASRLSQSYGRGRGRVMRIATAGTVAGILIFTIPGVTVVGTLAAAFIACFFGNIFVACVNSFIVMHQGSASAPALTESNALAALSGVIAPVFVGIAIASILGWRASIWVSVIGFVAIGFVTIELWRGHNLAVFGEPGQVLTRKASGALPKLTYCALVANMCSCGAVFCMSLWVVDLLREQAGLSAAAAAAGLGALTGGIFVGRAFGAGISRAIPAELLLKISGVVGITAFGFLWFAASAPVILPALFVTGLGMSLQWPIRTWRARGADAYSSGVLGRPRHVVHFTGHRDV